MNPEQWLSLKWNGGSTMSDRWLNQSKIIHVSQYTVIHCQNNTDQNVQTSGSLSERYLPRLILPDYHKILKTGSFLNDHQWLMKDTSGPWHHFYRLEDVDHIWYLPVWASSGVVYKNVWTSFFLLPDKHSYVQLQILPDTYVSEVLDVSKLREQLFPPSPGSEWSVRWIFSVLPGGAGLLPSRSLHSYPAWDLSDTGSFLHFGLSHWCLGIMIHSWLPSSERMIRLQ